MPVSQQLYLRLRLFGRFRPGPVLMLGAIALFAGCATRTPAPVFERSPGVAATVPVQRAAPSDRIRSHTVRRGETLYSIALEYGQDYKDLVAWNGLDNPNLIRVGQVLQVAPPAPPPVMPAVAQTPVQSVPPPPQTSPVQDGEQAAAHAVPVITGTVEQRPLGASTVVPTPLKTGPIGEKRPWSDAALAELSRPAVTAAASVATASPAASPPVTPSAAPVPQPAPPLDGKTASNDANGIGWIWPATGKLIEEFSEARNKGIDLAGRAGDTVIAAGDGRVVYAGSGLRGYGNLVIIKHDNDYLSAYAHNRVILVKEQQAIRKGQKIAEMGNSDADQVKLHFEIRHQGKPVDPMRYLPSR